MRRIIPEVRRRAYTRRRTMAKNDFEAEVLRRLDTIERQLAAIQRNLAAEPRGAKPAAIPAAALELLGRIANAVNVSGYDTLGRKVG
jgi:hypothetical protein